MTKAPAAQDYPTSITNVNLSVGQAPKRTVTFGNVTVTGEQPSANSLCESLQQSQRAMMGLVKALQKPGVRLPEKKNVPQFWVDEADTSVLFRRLNKKTERGRFVEGEFQVIE